MKRLVPIIILFFITLVYTKPYFRPGFFATHDGEWTVVRLAEMQREIKDWQIPPRWSDYLNHGYGYPLFSFTYPFPYYLGLIFRFFRIGLVDTIKIIFVGSVFISAFFMFLLGRSLAGNYAGLISAIFYIVAPFRLVNLYVRGSIGESVSLALVPLLFFLSLKYVAKPNLKYLSLCSFVLGLLVLSHNVMALTFFPIWIGFLYAAAISYFKDIKIYTWRYFLPMILLGLGLASYFFMPALVEMKYTALSQMRLADVRQHFINLPDYFTSAWSYRQPSYQLDCVHLLAALFGIIGLLILKKTQRKKYIPYSIFIIVGMAILVFLAHPISFKFWNLPPLSWLDFPWRFLSPLGFLLALSTIFLSIHRTTRVIGGILAMAAIFLNLRFATPLEYINKPDTYYATNDATTTSADELMPIWVINEPKNRYLNKVEIKEGQATIDNLKYNSRSIRFRVVSRGETTIKVNTIYFPGWEFTVDNKKAILDFSNPQGVIQLKMPLGAHQVVGRFRETPIRMWADIISIVSLGIIILLIIIHFLFKSRYKAI